MLIYKRNVHTKMRALSYIGAEKITFPPKPDRQTDIHTDGRTLASLLKKMLICYYMNIKGIVIYILTK